MTSAGFALAHRRRHTAPANHAAPGAWAGWRTFRVARRTFEDAAQTQCSFYLEPVDGLPLPAYQPGQFLTFSLPVGSGADGAPRTITRCYSLSDRPAANHYRVTIKRAIAPGQAPGVGSGYFHDTLTPGSTLRVRAPAGHFYLDVATPTPVVLIGCGIGITPMMSMLRWCAEHQPQRLVHLYYGVGNSAEQAYKVVLEDMAQAHAQLRLHVVYSRPLPHDRPGSDYQHTGHVDLALLQQTLPPGLHQFYLCGPARMMESLVPALAQWGVPRTHLHFEAFGPATVRLPGDDTPATPDPSAAALAVHFKRSGRSLGWRSKDGYLLDFAEAHGIELESGCRTGLCGSCARTVLQGTVAYDTPPAYPLEPGQCLLCVGKPCDALVLDA